MALTKTPICDFGKKAEDFKLQSINNKSVSLEEIKGKNGTLIMFICNHCPYVKAIIKDLVEDCKDLKNEGINSVAIMSNDTKNYPEDSFDKMIKFAKDNHITLLALPKNATPILQPQMLRLIGISKEKLTMQCKNSFYSNWIAWIPWMN